MIERYIKLRAIAITYTEKRGCGGMAMWLNRREGRVVVLGIAHRKINNGKNHRFQKLHVNNTVYSDQ
jgi:hypothetical protein